MFLVNVFNFYAEFEVKTKIKTPHIAPQPHAGCIEISCVPQVSQPCSRSVFLNRRSPLSFLPVRKNDFNFILQLQGYAFARLERLSRYEYD